MPPTFAPSIAWPRGARFAVVMVCMLCGCPVDSEPGTGLEGTDASDANVPGDAATDAPVEVACGELTIRFDQIVATLDRSCNSVSDCATLGGQPAWQFCQTYPVLGSMVGGTPVNAASAASSMHHAELESILAAWSTNCAGKSGTCSYPGGVPCVADAAQNPTVCENHLCVGPSDSCIHAPWDGGP